jgi:3-hydroxyacyl-CoA dehydrogenase
MANEAALLLAEGVASRPGDVDVVLVHGYGFPRTQGGPVFWARQQDVATLKQNLQSQVQAAGHGFALGDIAQLAA